MQFFAIPTNRVRRGFTLLEVCFTIAIFSLFSAASIYSLSQINRFASNSRYRTLALSVAQQKIDQIMTTPWSVMGTVPTVLAAGSVTEAAPTIVLPLNSDPLNSASGLSSAFTNYDTQILDSRTTVITKLTDCSGNTGASSRLLRATVTVTYTYRGKQASIVLSTLRGTDDF
jgi:prepilin-type N-terminal cleavage/methylation domain-containing protein